MDASYPDDRFRQAQDWLRHTRHAILWSLVVLDQPAPALEAGELGPEQLSALRAEYMAALEDIRRAVDAQLEAISGRGTLQGFDSGSIFKSYGLDQGRARGWLGVLNVPPWPPDL